MPSIRLPDGSIKSFDKPATVAEVAASIGAGLARAALAGRVDGKLVDTSFVIDHDADLAVVTEKDADGVDILRHSTAHLLAHAVKELYPDAQVTIGPVIEDGFYYDFSYKRPFTPEDLTAIEKRMTEIARRDIKVERQVWNRDKAVDFFKDQGEEYKAKIIAAIPGNESISLYSQGNLLNLCRGTHVPSPGPCTSSNIVRALRASRVSTSGGVATTTAPASGILCASVSWMSPVPGGRSTIR